MRACAYAQRTSPLAQENKHKICFLRRNVIFVTFLASQNAELHFADWREAKAYSPIIQYLKTIKAIKTIKTIK